MCSFRAKSGADASLCTRAACVTQMDAIAQLCGAPMLDEHVRPPADSATLEVGVTDSLPAGLYSPLTRGPFCQAVFHIGPEHAAAVEALVKGTSLAEHSVALLPCLWL